MGRDAGDFPDSPFDKLNVVPERQGGVDPPLEENRCDPARGGFSELPDHGIDGMSVRPLIPGMPVERAEDAVDIADVCVVRVGVDMERHARLRVLAETDLIGRAGKFEQFAVGEELQSFSTGEPFPRARLRADAGECHRASMSRRAAWEPGPTAPTRRRNTAMASRSRSPSE